MNAKTKSDEKRYSSMSFLDRLIKKIVDGSIGEVVSDWKWIFSYSIKYKWYIILYTVIGIAGTSFRLVSAVVSKYIIDIITGFQTSKLGFLIIGMVGSSLLSLLLSSVQSRVSTKIEVFIYNDIQADIFDKIIDADWISLNRYKNGDVLNRFSQDAFSVSSNAVGWVPSIILALYNFVATFCVIFHYNIVMGLLAFLSAPFMMAASKVLISKQRYFRRKTSEMASKLMSFESEVFYNFDTIKSFGIMDEYSIKMRKLQSEYKELKLKNNLFTISTNIFLSILGTLVSMIAFGYSLYLLWAHIISYGTMTLFLQQRSALTAAFNSLISLIPGFLSGSVSAHRVKELVDLPKERHMQESKELNKCLEQGIIIEMDHVDFSYEEGKHVIRDSNFIARPGEIVALVGPSGEGKTTMIRLILGLVYPDIGDVVLKGASEIDGIVSISANADVRHLFAYVPQGNSIFSGTIADNMRLVKQDATDQEIIDALKTACIWEAISQREEGINAYVGEKGKGLSEGQSQRLAIARAILRDSPILLLDEATSALDVATERQVLKNIIIRHPNKTCIITTHRPSVLNMCEKVYRVIDGRVVELDEKEASQMVIDF